MVRVLVSLAMLSTCAASLRASPGEEPMAPSPPARPRPFPAEDLRFWLESMILRHGFGPEEVALATGLGDEEIERLAAGFGLQWGGAGRVGATRIPEVSTSLLPYPGGRHPRIGFLEGAIDPWRESKVSAFLPWEGAGYVVVDLPEALWRKDRLVFLAHRHIPTVWEDRGVAIERRDWRRLPGGVLENRWILPDGLEIRARAAPSKDGVDMELALRNGTPERAESLRFQVCVMLKAAPGFNGQTDENKLAIDGAEAARSEDGRRWIVTVWERGVPWQNPPVPCIHSNPVFPDLAPGESARLRGRLLFVEGDGAEVSRRASEATLDLQASTPAGPGPRVPVIDVTDLYHPPQDVGDNFDIIAAYALPEIDLRAVVLDCTDGFRKPVADVSGMWPDPQGPREPGMLPIIQLNSIFDRNVPFGVGPFRRMRWPEDPMMDLPEFQQSGVELILDTLRRAVVPVHILSFGSARAVAVAFNRDPDLFRAKVAKIHLSAGSDSREFLEWNVQLDPYASIRLLRSDLPLALYPCGTKEGAFMKSAHDTYWKLPDLRFVARMDPRLRRYLAFALGRSARPDFLRAMEEDAPVDFEAGPYAQPHNVWETAVWAQVSGRRLAKEAGGSWRLVPPGEMGPGDEVFPEALRPCRLHVGDDGRFTFEIVETPSTTSIYERGDPEAHERACGDAIPALYLGFRP